MFTIAFRNGSNGIQTAGVESAYNEEYLQDTYKSINLQAQIGQTFMDFISIGGNLADSNHPYIHLADGAESISDNPWFLNQLRRFLDLGIDNEAFFSMPCLMYFLNLTGLQIPPIYHELVRKKGHEDDCLEDRIEETEGMDHFEHSMRAYIAAGSDIYDSPLTVYQCESIEDACIASLHFLITNQYNIRKCKNCGKYFVAFYRSDTEYCDRQSPYNASKTCKQDGPSRAYRDAMGTDEVKKVFHKIDSARRMRVSRNPDDEDILDEYEAWRDAMKKMRKKYKSGAITAAQFIEWLEENKSYDEDWDYE